MTARIVLVVMGILVSAEPTSGDDEGLEYSCGVHALYTACQLANVHCGIADVDAVVATDREGLNSLDDLRIAAEKLSAYPVVAHHRSRDPVKIPVGSVVHLLPRRPQSEAHFSVYVGVSENGRVILADAPIPPYLVDQRRFKNEWTGYVMTVFDSNEDADAYAASLSSPSIPI